MKVLLVNLWYRKTCSFNDNRWTITHTRIIFHTREKKLKMIPKYQSIATKQNDKEINHAFYE